MAHNWPLSQRPASRTCAGGGPDSDEPAPPASSTAALTLGALGVVYGDIGTSPLYALKQVFANGHVPLTPANIFGVLSLVFWTLTVVVSIKYVVLILRADNNGEGGLIAMLALASQAVADRPAAAPHAAVHRHLRHRDLLRRRRHHAGDLGARRRSRACEVAAPALHTYVVPITLVVLTALFIVPAPRHRAASAAVRAGDGGVVPASSPCSGWRTSATTRPC